MGTIHHIVNVEVAIVRDDRWLVIERGPGVAQAGTIAFVGGKAENVADTPDVLEATARREIMEEVGVAVGALHYVESHAFQTPDGQRVIDVLFVARWERHEPRPLIAAEVAAVHWLRFDEIMAHERAMPWTKTMLERADAVRKRVFGALTLTVLPERLAVCRLDPDAGLPAWAQRGSLWSITRTADELSIVCAAAAVPPDVRAERDWRALKVAGPLPFSLTGVLASLATPLAEAGISIFALSSYDTDYLLVREARLDAAITTLRGVGHRVPPAES
jgi:uncharacterized protein